jgi:mono/diheme cytochrome c family protein
MSGSWLNQRTIGVAGFVLVVAILLATTLLNRPSPGDAAQLRQGREIYVAYCASCHGINLEGAPNWQQRLANGAMPAPPHDATGHTWHHADDLLFQITKAGGQSVSPPGYVNAMPAFGGQLSDDEIWAVLAYIKSTWPADFRPSSARSPRRTAVAHDPHA